MRQIDADELMSLYEGEDENLKVSLRVVKQNIKDIPTIEAELVKHGRWICINGWVYCSVCHQEPPNESNLETDYCPNCGAKMDLDEVAE